MMSGFHELLQRNSRQSEGELERKERRKQQGPIQPQPFSAFIASARGRIPKEFSYLSELLDASADSGLDAIVQVTQEVLLSQQEIANLSIDQRRHRFKYLIGCLKEGKVLSLIHI